jgi:hypothetical protein
MKKVFSLILTLFLFTLPVSAAAPIEDDLGFSATVAALRPSDYPAGSIGRETPEIATALGKARVNYTYNQVVNNSSVKSIIDSGYKYYMIVGQSLSNDSLAATMLFCFHKNPGTGYSQDYYQVTMQFNVGEVAPRNAVSISKGATVNRPTSYSGSTLFFHGFGQAGRTLVMDKTNMDLTYFLNLSRTPYSEMVYLDAPTLPPSFTASYSLSTLSISR